MSLVLWTWLLSLSGAGLFFAAGGLWNRQRAGMAGPPPELDAELERLSIEAESARKSDASVRAHAQRLSIDAQNARAQADEVAAELSQVRQQVALLERAAFDSERRAHARAGAAGAEARALAAARAELATLAKELERARSERLQGVAELELERERGARDRRETEAERDSLAARVRELTSATPADAQSAALRHELTLTHETLLARDAELERLRDENARLRALGDDLAQAQRELAALGEEARLLRARAFVSGPPRKQVQRVALAGSSGRALQSIVDAEIGRGRARSAVIADELGLLVAVSGAGHEYGDALAAFGAYLADVGAKTRDVLPLHEVRQVTVRDDHDVTLTVRPIEAADHSFALVTLGVEPEQGMREGRKN